MNLIHPRPTLPDLPETARPYERISAHGTRAASDGELLAVLLQSGTSGRTALDIAHELLSERCFGSLGSLADQDPKRLESVNGIGPVKAIRLASAFELGRRLSRPDTEEPPICDTPGRCASVLIPEIGDRDREVFAVMLLNRRNRLLRFRVLAEGSIDRTVIEPRDVFKAALTVNAYAIVLAHNHPSGDPTPSRSDLKSTEVFISAGRMIGIPIHDHLIVTKERWISLRQTTDLFSEERNPTNR